MSRIAVAALQMTMVDDPRENRAVAERLIRESAALGAQIIVLPELFERPYFCKDHAYRHFESAMPIADSPAVSMAVRLARELRVVLPVSLYERAGALYFNTVVVVDADGSVLGHYRKSHIPESPGYHEKFYFAPGDTGFRVWSTRYGRLGVGICWDQWFPEAARAMVLAGADVIAYPTAIGSEPQDPTLDSRDHWTRVMQGHAAANIVPVVAANRFGSEVGDSCMLDFYGSSFITDHRGELLQCAGRADESVLIDRFDFSAIARDRCQWGVFRDRRPDLYGSLLRLANESSATGG
jgi:N-carbamoylputrescine amidase